MGVCCIVFDIDGMLFEFFMNFLNRLNGRWFLEIVDIHVGNFNMKLTGRWFPQWESISNIYITKIVVLVSEPVCGRSRATELPCFRVKGLGKMICGAVNRIFAYYRSLNCSQIIKKQRQKCLTSDNNNSTIADLPKKRSKDTNVRFIGFNSKIIVTNNYWCSYY